MDVCLLLTCRNRLLAVKNYQVRARGAVIGRATERVTPLGGPLGLISLQAALWAATRCFAK
jgi:hypothetical protein